jgi:hypothetical protein
MTAALRLPPGDVPTLTEVVGPSELAVTTAVPVEGPGGAVAQPVSIDEDYLAGQILDHVQQQIDLVLADLVDGLVRDLHQTLALALRDTVREAVAQALARLPEHVVHPGHRSSVD